MQIMIDIPEDIVTDIKDYCGMSIADAKEALPIILNAIHSGIPIPEGHGKIVDANRVLENGDNWEVETALMQTEAIIEADRSAIEDAIIEEAEEYEADLDN